MTKNGPEKCLLVVDDELPLARAVAKRFEREGYRSVIAETLREARVHLGMDDKRNGAMAPSLIVLDMRLPDGSGLDLISEVCTADAKAPPVIVLTAFGDLENAVEAMKRGAADYLRKPIDLDELALVTDRVLRTVDLENKLELSRKRERVAQGSDTLLGTSQQMREVRDQIKTFAAALAGNGGPSRPVLILGETGTGKDVAARTLHELSGNGDRPFVQIDCTAYASQELERQLFGCFGPEGRQSGLIEAAENGTVLLDEIGDLPLDIQAKLLHVVERQSIRPPSGGPEIRVRARLVAASNRPLAALARTGQFRSDLFYRLHALTVSMPPVRERDGDGALLAEHFAQQTARRFGRPRPRFSQDALLAIETYPWPGNVWEIKHLIERSVLLCRDQPITKDLLGIEPTTPIGAVAEPAQDEVTATSEPLAGMTLEAAERTLIEGALRKTGGNVSRAARILGVTRMAMRYRIEKHGIDLANPASLG